MSAPESGTGEVERKASLRRSITNRLSGRLSIASVRSLITRSSRATSTNPLFVPDGELPAAPLLDIATETASTLDIETETASTLDIATETASTLDIATETASTLDIATETASSVVDPSIHHAGDLGGSTQPSEDSSNETVTTQVAQSDEGSTEVNQEDATLIDNAEVDQDDITLDNAEVDQDDITLDNAEVDQEDANLEENAEVAQDVTSDNTELTPNPDHTEVTPTLADNTEINAAAEQPDGEVHPFIPGFIQKDLFNDNNKELVMSATRHLRKFLSRQGLSTAQIGSVLTIPNILLRLVHLMEKGESPTRFEAAWALTNIASGDSEATTQVSNSGAVQVAKLILEQSDSEPEDLVEQCVWLIGNIAGDNFVLRDFLLTLDFHLLMRKFLKGTYKLSMNRNAAWCMSNFFRGEPQTPLELAIPCIESLEEVLCTSTDSDTLCDTIWSLVYITKGSEKRIDAVIDGTKILGKLIELFASEIDFEGRMLVGATIIVLFDNVLKVQKAKYSWMLLDNGILGSLIRCHDISRDPLRYKAIGLLHTMVDEFRDIEDALQPAQIENLQIKFVQDLTNFTPSSTSPDRPTILQKQQAEIQLRDTCFNQNHFADAPLAISDDEYIRWALDQTGVLSNSSMCLDLGRLLTGNKLRSAYHVLLNMVVHNYPSVKDQFAKFTDTERLIEAIQQSAEMVWVISTLAERGHPIVNDIVELLHHRIVEATESTNNESVLNAFCIKLNGGVTFRFTDKFPMQRLFALFSVLNSAKIDGALKLLVAKDNQRGSIDGFMNKTLKSYSRVSFLGTVGSINIPLDLATSIAAAEYYTYVRNVADDQLFEIARNAAPMLFWQDAKSQLKSHTTQVSFMPSIFELSMPKYVKAVVTSPLQRIFKRIRKTQDLYRFHQACQTSGRFFQDSNVAMMTYLSESGAIEFLMEAFLSGFPSKDGSRVYLPSELGRVIVEEWCTFYIP